MRRILSILALTAATLGVSVTDVDEAAALGRCTNHREVGHEYSHSHAHSSHTDYWYFHSHYHYALWYYVRSHNHTHSSQYDDARCGTL